jgi:uncharacterized SAM-binding protein YcdF (DUF218 family)
MKTLKRCLLILPAVFILAWGALGFFFFGLLSGEPRLEPADVIVAFAGREDRARIAYRLADSAYADRLVVSPATEAKIRSYDRRYRPVRLFDRILEEKARTTFENALYTRRIVERNHLKSLILVTSWDHMPRSYLLLKAMLLGTDTRLHLRTTPTGRLNRENWYRHAVGWKMIYNEMVQCWGSLIELVHFKMKGALPATVPGKSSMLSGLKQFLLFDIDPRELGPNPYKSTSNPRISAAESLAGVLERHSTGPAQIDADDIK